MLNVRLRERLYAGLAHLAISAIIAAVVATLTLWLWFPEPFGQIAGGRDLFVLVLAVDVVLGPLLTVVAFDRRKPGRELRRDLVFIALLQLGGLAYGLNTLRQARPIVLALEVDRLRVVRAVDLPAEELTKGPSEFRSLGWFGIQRVAARQPRSGDEQLEATMAALGGVDVGARPEFWLPSDRTDAAWAAAGRPLSDLRKRQPSRTADIDLAIRTTGKAEAELKYLPIVARRTDYIALIDAQRGTIEGYAAIDGF
jgi:hypothetical protein